MEHVEHGLEEIMRQRNLFQELHASSTTARPAAEADISTEQPRHRQLTDTGNTWRLAWLAVLLAGVMAVWLVPSVRDTARAISNVILVTVEKITAPATPGLQESYDPEHAGAETHPPVTTEKTGRASEENRSGHAYSTGSAELHHTPMIASAATATPVSLHRQSRAVPVMPALTTLRTHFVVDGAPDTQKPRRIAAGNIMDNGRLAPHHGEQPAANVQNEGQWVVNLASSSNKADADVFMEKARTQDIDTEQQQVTVKGKQYWRVQIAGLSTAEEAREIASTAKEKLGLNDIWISTR